MKRGFTIVELLMVVAIIGILLGLSATAVTGAVKRARDEQAEACVTLVNQGVEVYYAMKGRWPEPIGSRVENGSGFHLEENEDFYLLTASEVRQVVKALVDEARQGRPPMDISGLFVSRKTGEGGRDYGMDFMSAIHGTKKNPTKMSSGEMYFGYPESSHGYFRRFKAKYYPKVDRLVFER